MDGNNGMTVNSSNCDSLHQAETSSTCNVDPCPTYSWKIGAWETCSSLCNSGLQTRSVTCISSVGNTTVQDVNCGGVTKPITEQTCNTDPCVAARWVTGFWGICSASCAGGSQSRTVQCMTTTDMVTTDGNCQASRPASSQTCNSQTCEVYVWNPCPTYYPCTASCYGGTGMLGVRYKDVFCVSSNTLQAADPSLCDIASMPKTNYSSCNPQKCTGYNWMANANWGPCQAVDGQFTRTRSFHCHAADGSVALSSACSSVPLPVASLPCVPNTCLTGIPDIVSSAAFAGLSFIMGLVSLLLLP